MRSLFALSAIVLQVCAGSLAFAGTDQRASSFVLCKGGNREVRTIRVTPDAENCMVTYSKSGVDEVVGSNRSIAACKSFVNKVKANLEASKFNCRDISKATVTTSNEASRQ